VETEKKWKENKYRRKVETEKNGKRINTEGN